MGMFGTCLGLASAIGALWLVRKWRERQWGECRSTKRLDGQIIIITGATSGLGRALAENLAGRGATVVLACRNFTAARETVFEIKQQYPQAKLDVVELDLSSLDSVRRCAGILLERYPKINVLINNAGVSVPPESAMKTKEGYEINFGVNHLGHFLLTNLLIERMKESSPSRIVVVSSKLHEQGVIDLDALGKSPKNYASRRRPNIAYCNSKLANVLFAQELAQKLKDHGVHVYTVCPGWNYTQLFRYSSVSWYSWIFIFPIAFWFMKPARIGIQTIVHCAISDESADQTGLFYRDCKVYRSQANLDPEISSKLWQTSYNMCGL